MLRQHPAALRLRQLVAPAFTIALFGLPILAFFSQCLGVLWIIILGVYIVISTLAAARATTAIQRQATPTQRPKYWHVVFAFAIIHISWGVGFIRSMLSRYIYIKK
jgi:ABC-type transport system involved in cytochrome bd biosynthesis fused ATPase/permease subunit